MRYYKKIIGKKLDASINNRSETRDAVVWDIFDGYCRVKIQGSDKFVVAHFPENLDSSPVWLRIGNAVKIQHTGGERGRIEIAGHSNIIPTNVPTASIIPADNAVIEGCALVARKSYTQLKIGVAIGTYTIDGVVYKLLPIKMAEDNLFILGDNNFLGYISSFIEVSPCLKNRYDVIVAGKNSLPSIVSGEEVDNNPIMPSISASVIRLGWILLYPGISEISSTDLNIYYYQQDIAASLGVVIDDSDMLWADSVTTNINISVLSTKGVVISGEYYIKAYIMSGNGHLTSLEDGDGTSVGQHSINNITTISYTRNHNSEDISPVIKFILVSISLEAQNTIILRDSNGDIMI